MSEAETIRALRGRLLWFVADPQEAGEAAHRYVEDGLLVIERPHEAVFNEFEFC